MAMRKIYDLPNRKSEDDPHRELREAARAKLVREARGETLKCDPVLESEIMRRLDALGEPYKTDFLRMRELSMQSRRDDEPLSQQEIDSLNLQAMERSAAFRGDK